MRILHFLNTFGGTTTTFIHNQVKVLQQEHEVAVACTLLRDEHRFYFDPIYVLPYQPNTWLQRLRRRLRWYNIRMTFYEPAFAKALNEILQDFEPDVIHCQFGPDALKFIDNLRYRKKEIPIFIQFRGYDASLMLQESPVYVRRMHSLVKRPNIHPIFVADYLYQKVREYGIAPDKRRILYSCTDLSFFQRRAYPDITGPKIFLQVSSFTEKKGHQYTLEAFSRFEKEHSEIDWQLVLAGDGPLREDMMARSRQSGLQGKVYFPGRVTHAQARDLMEQAHYFVHHSVTAANGSTEGIPNALMEAMAMELPVIATRHAGIPELVVDGVHGYLVAERDVEKYSSSIYKILSWGFQPRSRRKVKEQFELQRHKEQLLSYYEEELKEWRRKY